MLEIPGVNQRLEVECLDRSVEREVSEVSGGPGEGRKLVVMSWSCHSPELLASLEETSCGELHVEGPVALVTHHVVQLLPLAHRAGECQVDVISGMLYPWNQ